MDKLRKNTDKFYCYLESIFDLKHEIDNKKYRREIYCFLRFINDAENQTTFISYVKAFKHKNKIVVEIETHRPGLLIGRAGSFIDKLKAHLIEELKEDITIKLTENKVWMNLYEH